jgi:hypothetical protein
MQSMLGRSQAVRHGTLDPACVGSNPAAPANCFHAGIRSADVAELADALDLGSSGVTSLRVRVPPSAPVTNQVISRPSGLFFFAAQKESSRKMGPISANDFWNCLFQMPITQCSGAAKPRFSMSAERKRTRREKPSQTLFSPGGFRVLAQSRLASWPTL